MRIRDAQPEDVYRLAEIHTRTWQSSYRGILGADYLASLCVEDAAQRWRGWILNPRPGQFHLVAESEGGGVVGFASGGPGMTQDRKKWGDLNAIYILEEHQRKGIGSALLRAAAARMKKQGCDGMVSWMLRENPAGTFYRKMGGIPVDKKVEVIGGVEKDLTAYGWMDLDIAP
jgi:GNAT superfamily N-acetyltransferase